MLKPKRIRVYNNINKKRERITKSRLKNDDPLKLNDLLLDIIVSRRLYKDEDLEKFYANVRNHCKSSPRAIENAIKNVKSILESY